jgi:hypothetical protein
MLKSSFRSWLTDIFYSSKYKVTLIKALIISAISSIKSCGTFVEHVVNALPKQSHIL